MSDIFISIIKNPLLRRHLNRVAVKTGIEFDCYELPFEISKSIKPTIIVFEIEMENAISYISEWKKEWPNCFLAASVSNPDKELWMAAIAGGCDLVSNRGSLPNLLRKKIESYLGGFDNLVPKTVCLLAKSVFNQNDGLVARLPDNPEDPISVFRIGKEYYGIRDTCPHAGFSLADGDLDSKTGIVTCPEHGSQFNIRTGERIRGPADYSIKTYSVKVEGSDIYVNV